MKLPPLPPLYLVLGLAAIACLHRFLSVLNLLPAALASAGIVVAVLGGLLALLGGGALLRHRTTISFGRSAALITSGIYGRSRNPLYVAMLLALLGAALWSRNLVALALPPLVFLALDKHMIPLEEAKMVAEFGEGYRAYMARVRRWV